MPPNIKLLLLVLQVCVGEDTLAVGDYMWMLQEGTSNSSYLQRAAATTVVTAAGTPERSACLVAGAVVERKTIRDIQARSSEG